MDDKSMADTLIDLGVVTRERGNGCPDSYYVGKTYHHIAYLRKSPLVVTALIGMCKLVSWTRTTTGGSYVYARASDNGYGETPAGEENEAIIVACVEALTADQTGLPHE